MLQNIAVHIFFVLYLFLIGAIHSANTLDSSMSLRVGRYFSFECGCNIELILFRLEN